ncbi:MAG: hypothetical protein E7118_06220 [Bacteroidales bacterium]|nr:hypothetical protein [Bacteroidales bacterium]
MAKNGKNKEQKGGFWNFIDNIEGDKVVWIIVFMLTMISALAIFSSTSQLTGDKMSRIDMIKNHSLFILAGYVIIIGLYKINRIGLFRVVSQFGFMVSLVLLTLLTFHCDFGFIKAQYINKAWRTLEVFGFQLHVFEVVKVAMVMYLAWALHAYKQDQEAIAKRKKSTTLTIANLLAQTKTFSFMSRPFWKRAFYMYIPMAITCLMVMKGSNSSGIFIGGIMIATLLIGGIPFKEIGIAIAGAAVILAMAIGIWHVSDGKVFDRVGTLVNRMTADYSPERLAELEEQGKSRTKEWYEIRDAIKQPYTAKIAIHEGGLLGKGSGNSTQKYVVTHIYSDYMFSFLIEEYGLIGGILVILLYVSLLARGSMIARLCSNEYAKITVGGLSILITGQAFMHMFVNAGIGPMTGQTLPLISDGSFAFIVFCFAFGVILSISRMANNRIREEEEAAAPLYEGERDDIQASLDVVEQIDMDI